MTKAEGSENLQPDRNLGKRNLTDGRRRALTLLSLEAVTVFARCRRGMG